MARPLRTRLDSLRRAVLRRRRLLAAACVAIATAATLQALAPPPPESVDVVLAAHALPAGATLTSADLRVVRLSDDTAPSAHLGLAELPGRVLAAPVGANEPLTATRVVSASALAPEPGQVSVPVRLPDAGVVALLRVGDEVDLWVTDPQLGGTERVATQARVITIVADDEPDPTLGGRLVVVAASPSEAQNIANAAVVGFLSVAFVD